MIQIVFLLHYTLTFSPLEYLPKLCNIQHVVAISAYIVTRLILETKGHTILRYLTLEGEIV